MMTIKTNNYEDHRNVTVPSGTTVEIKLGGTVVYTHVVSTGKNANIAFQLQEVEEIIE